MEINNRNGEQAINRQGHFMTIINYKRLSDFDVLFEDGYIKHCLCYNNFKQRRIKNPNMCSKVSIGVVGMEQGEYDSKSISYSTWRHMLDRCYNKNEYRYKYYGLVGVGVCEEWKTYKLFKEWFDENYYEVLNDKMNLDKDILIKGNKVYSPETCIFVPSKINKLFTKATKIRGEYPIGVGFQKQIKKYVAKITKENKQVHLGCFDNPMDAFYCYKDAKESYIKEIADMYKDEIPQKLYDAMYSYKVERTD